MTIINYPKLFTFLFTTSGILFSSSCQDKKGLIEGPGTTNIDKELKTTSVFDANVPNTYYEFMITDLIKETPGFSSPVVSRSLGYIGVALYESVIPGTPSRKSLLVQLQELTYLPIIEESEKYYWPLCANAAMYNIIKNIYSNATIGNIAILDSIYANFNTEFSRINNDIYNHSIAFGEDIAEAIFEWSKTDGGHEKQLEQTDPSYIPPEFFGAWVPTPIAFAAALQPHWGDNRTFIETNQSLFTAPPVDFSSSPASNMYAQANEVYTTDLSLTEEQEEIALYWSDGSGTITPAGHSLNIAKQILEAEGADLLKAALTYAKLGISQADAFITCWKSKYFYNLMRPVTYIQTYIDPSWLPLIGTPPFPEYTSGHSAQSGAMYTVLENIWGTNYAFTDHTWESTFGTRSFDSFKDAAYEASLSRLYGGIHYRMSCRYGLMQGVTVGENVNALSWE